MSSLPRVFVAPAVFRLGWLVVFLVVAPANPALGDKEEECEVVDELAKIAVRDWDAVTVSADEDDKICRFSVNGAVADSPPREQVRSAYQTLIGSQPRGVPFSRSLSEDRLSLWASLLLAAGPDNDVNAITNILRSQYSLIEDCTESLEQHRSFRKTNSSSVAGITAETTCIVMGTEQRDSSIVVGPFTVRTILVGRVPPWPQMVLVVRRDSIWVALTVARRR